MSLARIDYWMKQAYDNHYALAAFNFNTLEQAQAIVQAAELEKSPVILQVSHNALKFSGNGNPLLGIRYVAAYAHIAADSVDVPVVLHLDYGTYEEVLWAFSLGFTSAMFDGRNLSWEDNLKQAKELVTVAKSTGIHLESEVGRVPRLDEVSQNIRELTDPQEALEYVNETGIDALAVSVGSSHGEKRPISNLDLDLLEKIYNTVSIPLVLHGSSGVREDDLQKAFTYGVAKVNTATMTNQSFSGPIAGFLSAARDTADPRKYLIPARHAMVDAVRKRIRQLGTTGLFKE
ncbi:MAG: class II fructose-bisphosphate aldolase [Anaerolineales bacterium]|nr:class II fructose-bisphosphate aldolase [Anaerolineales bacterium]